MRIDIVTIFPEFFGVLDVSLLGKARERGLIEVGSDDRWSSQPEVNNLRSSVPDHHWSSLSRPLADARLRLTRKGRLLADAVVRDLLD